MSALTVLFRSVFPPLFTKEKHDKAMRKHVRRIVAHHSDGSATLQRGAYMTAEDMSQLRRRSSRITAHAH